MKYRDAANDPVRKIRSADEGSPCLSSASRRIRIFSGSSSCQTFNVSTAIEALADLHASMNDVVRVIESEDSPLGDD